jgi:hypothetical protein
MLFSVYRKLLILLLVPLSSDSSTNVERARVGVERAKAINREKRGMKEEWGTERARGRAESKELESKHEE